jgi:hypothetical protein
MMRRTKASTTDMSPIAILDRKDLELLMVTDPKALLGRILELNREIRYHNRLDAVRLAACINELRLSGKRK